MSQLNSLTLSMKPSQVLQQMEPWLTGTATGLIDYSKVVTLSQPVFPWQGVTVADAPVRMDMVTTAKTKNVMDRLRSIQDNHEALGHVCPPAVKLMIDRIATHCEEHIEVDDSLWSVLGGRL